MPELLSSPSVGNEMLVGFPASLVAHLEQLGEWGVLTTDTELRVTYWNGWLVKRSGVLVSSIVGRPLFEIFPELRDRGFERQYRQVIGGQPVVLSHLLHGHLLKLRPDIANSQSELMQQSVRILPIMEGGIVVGTLTLIEDVTERVLYETELKLTANRQAAVATASRIALVGLEVEEVACEIVKLARSNLGEVLVEVLEHSPKPPSWTRLAGDGWGKTLLSVFDVGTVSRANAILTRDLISIEDFASEPTLADDIQLQNQNVRSALIVRVGSSAERRFGLVGLYSKQLRKFTSAEIEFVRALADVLAMTVERNRLGTELRKRVSELAEAAQRKDEFLAMLAHELRNPLAPVRNGLMILQMTENKPEVARTTREMMGRQVRHLSRLVDDLLDVSRITRGKVELRLEPIDLTEVANQAIETARPLIESRKHRLNVSHHGGAIRLMGDATRLAQVLGNLLTNAAKYTDYGGEIGLSLSLRDGEAVVEVRDTGIGIAPLMLPKIFDLFTQVESTLDRSQGGLGIGLTLVKTLVEMHGGRVQAYSDGPGKGSTFVVNLPAFFGDSTESLATQGPEDRVRSHRILVIDDNEDSAESLAIVLRYSGHDVRTAHSGPQGLHVAHEFRPEVIFLDIGLPAMDGYEVARRLRKLSECQETRLIAMTGYGSEDDRRKSNEAGFDQHLVKPLDPADLGRFL